MSLFLQSTLLRLVGAKKAGTLFVQTTLLANPFVPSGPGITADSTLITADSTLFTADET